MMNAERAMDIGMAIAEEHQENVLELYHVAGDCTFEQALRGCVVDLAAHIMMAITRALEDEHNTR